MRRTAGPGMPQGNTGQCSIASVATLALLATKNLHLAEYAKLLWVRIPPLRQLILWPEGVVEGCRVFSSRSI